MPNGDTMVRATALDGRVRAFALNATGVDEEADEATEVVRHFCNQAYHYTAADMAALLAAAR